MRPPSLKLLRKLFGQLDTRAGVDTRDRRKSPLAALIFLRSERDRAAFVASHHCGILELSLSHPAYQPGLLQHCIRSHSLIDVKLPVARHVRHASKDQHY